MPNALDPQSPAPPERAIGESAGGIGLDVLSQIAHAMWTMPQRLTNESERMRYGVGYDPGPAVEASMLTMGATPFGLGRGAIGAGEAALGAGPIRAYHGSPYDFERFDMSKIGTGEGNQAYGHGIYAAENPATAQTYKTAGPEGARQLDVINDRLVQLAREMDKYPRVTYNKFADPKGDALKAEYDRLLEEREKVGKTYEVSINADPEHFLDWDKKVRDMPPAVQERLAKAGYNINGPDQGLLGSQIAQRDTGQLRSAGIPGIKYLDQGSRAGGEGTRNYVLFRDDIIDILRKYGLVGMLGGGAAANALFPRRSGSNALQFQ